MTRRVFHFRSGMPANAWRSPTGAVLGGLHRIWARLLCGVAFMLAPLHAAQDVGAQSSLVAPAYRLSPDAAAWRDLVERFARRPDSVAEFEERRFFPFRKAPVELRGEVRVSHARGLSLRYTVPTERTIILDDQGLLIRDPKGKSAPPPDARANLANEALRHILRLDFAELERTYEVYGRREGDVWSLALVPRAEDVRRAIGTILVDGEREDVRRIELRRSVKQHIDIVMSAPQTSAPFTAEELKRFFR
jgi:hypothetical protein